MGLELYLHTSKEGGNGIMPRFIKLALCVLFILWLGSKLSEQELVAVAKAVGLPQLPTSSTLESYRGQDNQKLVEVNGLLIADYNDHRVSFVPLDRLPNYLRYAFIATEDARYFQHGPVDPKGILRAAATNLQSQQIAEGGSTITQQLAKNMFLSQEQTLLRKLQEVYLAYQLEQVYSKNQILEMYLNQIYFGGGMYGVDRAARKIFGISAQEVNLAQAAMLAGIPKHPNKYWPLAHPEAAIQRQGIVLDRMVALGYITREEAELAKEQVVLQRVNSK